MPRWAIGALAVAGAWYYFKGRGSTTPLPAVPRPAPSPSVRSAAGRGSLAASRVLVSAGRAPALATIDLASL